MNSKINIIKLYNVFNDFNLNDNLFESSELTPETGSNPND